MSLFAEIEKTLGSFHLRVQFEAGDEVLSLLGASGCGKSMTLKCIAGIEKPDKGKIVLNGKTLFDSEKGINLPPQKRRVGYLFQQYALFPNMTVEQNIAVGVWKKEQKEKITREAIAAMHLQGLEKQKPNQLSGGQQQRVALARILVNQPDVLLLDEPFSALDSHLRFQLEQEVQNVIRSFGKTVILVSHNRDEAYRLSRRIAVLNQGSMEVIGSREEVFANPQTRMGAVMTGCKNISRIEKKNERRLLASDWGLELHTAEDIGNASCVGLRLQDLQEARTGENCFPFLVTQLIRNPFTDVLMLVPQAAPEAEPLAWEVNRGQQTAAPGDRLSLCIPAEKLLLLRESH